MYDWSNWVDFFIHGLWLLTLIFGWIIAVVFALFLFWCIGAGVSILAFEIKERRK